MRHNFRIRGHDGGGNLLLAAATALLALTVPAAGGAAESFNSARIVFEQNLQDGDAEIMLKVDGGKTGLAALDVVAPDGRTVVNMAAPASKFGLRQFTLETPEPKNLSALVADFPAGVYHFRGRAVDGTELRAEATLEHAMPEPAMLLFPAPDGGPVPARGLRIRWRGVANLASVIVVVEQERSGQETSAILPGDATSFVVADGLLAPDTDYKLAIGTVGKNGNRSFIEAGFTTTRSQ